MELAIAGLGGPNCDIVNGTREMVINAMQIQEVFFRSNRGQLLLL